jgi:hypothetical protein
MFFAANIDSRSVGVDYRQAFEMNFLVALFFFLRIAFDCFNKWGRLGIGLLDSPTGSSLPKGAATKQITAKAPEPC